ncbi:ATP-binding cassette subfamily C protein [Mycoplana sp. BE70]|uniref:type I secretion system permease/ATPase n=1 Tax=Mycoplana sp. BE70 TaxID=2817775 RepID=UPI00285E8516|nr:type I secretion system permease/ATPase [Mycoplana sp. BE70]MDR6757074.1 ATP-binding cassette subfamily C protein [Mycoplana sp. BE70]
MSDHRRRAADSTDAYALFEQAVQQCRDAAAIDPHAEPAQPAPEGPPDPPLLSLIQTVDPPAADERPSPAKDSPPGEAINTDDRAGDIPFWSSARRSFQPATSGLVQVVPDFTAEAPVQPLATRPEPVPQITKPSSCAGGNESGPTKFVATVTALAPALKNPRQAESRAAPQASAQDGDAETHRSIGHVKPAQAKSDGGSVKAPERVTAVANAASPPKASELSERSPALAAQGGPAAAPLQATGHDPAAQPPQRSENTASAAQARTSGSDAVQADERVLPTGKARPAPVKREETVAKGPEGIVTIEGDTGPIKTDEHRPNKTLNGGGGKGTGSGGGTFHKRLGPVDFSASLKAGVDAVRRNLVVVMIFTLASNILVLAIPIYLFQISDRVLTSRSMDTLIMLTLVIVGAIVLQSIFDAIRRFILMRTAVEVAAQLGAPILSAAARASLNSNGREYQTLGDLQQVRSFLVSRTLLSFLDAPLAPFFVVAVFLIHPHLGAIVIATALMLLVFTLINQRLTAASFAEANTAQVKANLHLESMSRNSQIINALAMIPEAVQIWGRDTAASLKAQVIAQDRNIAVAAASKGVRLLAQVAMLGWGAHLAIQGEMTGGMVIASSIIAGRGLAPIEGAIEGWHQYSQSRAAYGRITALLKASPLNFERLNLPRPEGRLDVERLLYVPGGTKRVVLNGISFALQPGDSLAVIGNSGAGKTTLGKMLVGSILPTSGNVRLDLMDLRNWDQRQFGENIGYLPQDVQLFPGTIKANIARMREDATDEQIYRAAMLADVHEMIATLPHGYETIVAADGAPLSGGQKQRIALARAFFGDPRMVVLDEPNSNLDSAGDAALTRALQHAKDHKITVITITQRPSLLNSVDKVLLMVNGTVALFGMRQDVLKALEARGINTETGSFGHLLQ